MLTTLPLKSPEHYRAEADRLRREAEQSTYPAVREQLLALSRSYDGLATTVEAITRGRPH